VGPHGILHFWERNWSKDASEIQSLLQTCRLQNIDPFVYLVDVLQRIQNHPISQVEDLIPRNWKNNFAENPLKAVLL
jgi:hypothetical protein